MCKNRIVAKSPEKIRLPHGVTAGMLITRSACAIRTMLLRFEDSHADPSRQVVSLYVSLAPQNAHPRLERPSVKTSLALNFAVRNRRAAQHISDALALVRLPKHQPSVKPDRRAHSRVMLRFEQDPSQSGVEVLLAHPLRSNSQKLRAIAPVKKLAFGPHHNWHSCFDFHKPALFPQFSHSGRDLITYL
jgi:hypothetical protein